MRERLNPNIITYIDRENFNIETPIQKRIMLLVTNGLGYVNTDTMNCASWVPEEMQLKNHLMKLDLITDYDATREYLSKLYSGQKE